MKKTGKKKEKERGGEWKIGRKFDGGSCDEAQASQAPTYTSISF